MTTVSKKLAIQKVFDSARRLLNGDQTNDLKPIIAVYGLLNAGKSCLLNMLTGHIETEHFKTADKRETTELNRYETDKFIFLDTPGLDADEQDDIKATQGSNQADVILFVHQTPGELEENELFFLTSLKESFGEFADKNIILILSKSDNDNQSSGLEKIRKAILEQCKKLGFKPKFFEISSKRYQTGIRKKDQGLILHSQIPKLIKYLEGMIIDVAVTEVRNNRKLGNIIEVCNDLDKLLEHEKTEVSKLKEIWDEKFSSFNEEMNSFYSRLDENIKEYQNI